MGLSEFRGPTSAEDGIKAIHRALELGIDHFDTADMYGHGANEELVGAALAGRCGQVVIATKCGIVRSADGHRRDGRPQYIRDACLCSLKRLRREYVDLLYLHRVDPCVPIEDSVGEIARLVAEGKVRAIGLSKIDGGLLRRARTVAPIATVQMSYSASDRRVEAELLQVCREVGSALVAYSPLGGGSMARADVAGKLERVARDYNATPAQLALAWLLSRGPDVVPIPGMRLVAHVEENVAACRKVERAELEGAVEAVSRIVTSSAWAIH
jgi:aryl-alcohol dehydrogenase-like predicted oxidoreductase